jgi:hypothetical protein
MIRLAMMWNCSAARRRRDALLVPNEQRSAELGFEIGDRGRDRRLRDEQPLRRCCQVALREHGREIAKLADIHSLDLSNISIFDILPMA